MVEDPHDQAVQDPQEVHVPEGVQDRTPELPEEVPGPDVENGSNSQYSENDRPPGTDAQGPTTTEPAANARTSGGHEGRREGIGFVLPDLSGMRLDEDSDEHSIPAPRPPRRLSHELNIHGLIRETPKKRSTRALVAAG